MMSIQKKEELTKEQRGDKTVLVLFCTKKQKES